MVHFALAAQAFTMKSMKNRKRGAVCRGRVSQQSLHHEEQEEGSCVQR